MDTEKIKVYVVDSSEVWRRIIISHIESAPDIEVVGDINSSQGSIIMLDEVNPDVVMLDVNAKDRMPVAEVVTQLKAINANVRIILCTDKSNKDSVVSAMERGASDFILKPYKRQNILRSIYNSMNIFPAE